MNKKILNLIVYHIIIGSSIFISISFTVWFSSLFFSGISAIVYNTSIGASSILFFALPYASTAKLHSFIIGQAISAFMGVTCYKYIPSLPIAAGLSVSLSLLIMSLLRSIHPPSGSTALTVVLADDDLHNLGYSFIFMPVLANSLVLLLLVVITRFILRKLGAEKYPSLD